METYFKLKLFFEFGVPGILILLFILWAVYKVVSESRKENILMRRGFHAEEYLDFGNNHCTRYKKNDIIIEGRIVESMKIKELKQLIKEKGC